MQSRAMRDGEQSTLSDDSGKFPAPQDDFVPLAGKVPEAYLIQIMSKSPDAPWHPTRLAERIHAQVERLGLPRSALLRAAHVPEKSVRDLESGHWPNLRRVVQLAAAFKFPGGVSEFLGIATEADPKCDPRLLHIALELVGAALDTQPGENPLLTRPHIVAGLAAVAHQQLIDLRRIDANALDNAAVLHMISVMLRSELANFDREKS